MINLRDNRGLVSFLVVIFISILLVVITAAFVKIMSRDLRQATDNELSKRAFYAAEAGIEESLLDIRNAIENDNISAAEQKSCDQDTFGDGTTGYSCRLVTFEPNILEGSLNAGSSRQFNLARISHDTIHVQWHEKTKDYPDNGQNNFSIPNNNPPSAAWPNNTPPIMRIEVLSYPRKTFNRNDIEQRVVFLRPRNGSFQATAQLSDIQKGEGMRVAYCDRGKERYACSFAITHMNSSNNTNHFVRIKPLYNATHYGVEALSGGVYGNSVPIPGNMAVIDVTGYANDVFRRLQAHIPLENVDTFGQDYVLLADDGLCKVMRVSKIDRKASTNDGCEYN